MSILMIIRKELGSGFDNLILNVDRREKGACPLLV